MQKQDNLNAAQYVEINCSFVPNYMGKSLDL